MRKIKVRDIIINDKIEVSISIEGDVDFLTMFNSHNFIISLDYNVNVSECPKSIAVIPAISLMLPVAWIFDAEVTCESIDKTFYDAIDQFKQGYVNMYPEITFAGKVSPHVIEDNSYLTNGSLVLFSGGVDAFNTLASHYYENPDLLTIWGADVSYDNENGWLPVKKQLEKISCEFNLNSYIVHSNCRQILNDRALLSYISKFNPKYNWWHDFQHGICIISHAAPISFVNNYETVYIASTFTAKDIGNYTCASDPTIDNFVRFGSTLVKHDGYEFSRQDKIKNISTFRDNIHKDIPLRVCYESKNGDNCCRCEKCYRTIMGIIAEKKDPIGFGFDKFDISHKKKMIHDLRIYKIPNFNFRYKYIQDRFNHNYGNNCPKEFTWFHDLCIDIHGDWSRYRKAWRLKRKIMRGCTKLFGIKW